MLCKLPQRVQGLLKVILISARNLAESGDASGQAMVMNPTDLIRDSERGLNPAQLLEGVLNLLDTGALQAPGQGHIRGKKAHFQGQSQLLRSSRTGRPGAGGTGALTHRDQKFPRGATGARRDQAWRKDGPGHLEARSGLAQGLRLNLELPVPDFPRASQGLLG